MKQRWKITIEYDGSEFFGWQRQQNGLSVQQVLEQAIFQFSSENVLVQGAGRTDSGVHAIGQVAHFDLVRPLSNHKMRAAINHFLKPYAVGVLKAEAVAQNFHARFSAKARTYLYRISTRPTQAVLERGKVWHHRRPLDAVIMHQAGQIFLGTHDFTSFRAQECQAKSPIKTIDALSVKAKNPHEIEICISARSFLHHQVRNFVGSLAWVGRGKWQIADLETALRQKNRAAAGPTAPAYGLYLTKVSY